MRTRSASLLCRHGIFVAAALSFAVAQQVRPTPIHPDANGIVPLYHVTVVGRSIPTVNFPVLGGGTKLQLWGTNLLPYAHGEASVQVARGATRIHAEFQRVNPAQRFGPEYLTYVMWAITPDGRAKNLGEVQLRGQSATLDVTTTLQQFGLIVTAEPYFAVSRPSELVVMEAQVTPGTAGARAMVEAKAKLLQRDDYQLHVDPALVTVIPQDDRVVLDLYEADNAVRIAGWAGANQYARPTYRKARAQLEAADAAQSAGESRGAVATLARQAVQTAEDARLLALAGRQQQTIAEPPPA